MAEEMKRGVILARTAGARKHRLMATTALVGALLGASVPAWADPDNCTTGATSTCTGDQSQGIASNDDFPSSSTVLNVNNLTKNITPASGTNGIYFSGDTTVEINSTLGSKSINVTGTADGILATAPGNVTVNHQGKINGGQNGINAYSTGANVAVDAFGNISNTSANAINAYAPNGGIEIDYFGNINNAGDRGISAYGKDSIEIDHFGKISSSGQGIYARSENGSVDIDSWGSVTSTNSDGVRGEAQSAGQTVDIERFGNVNAADHGIIALANGNALVDSIGNVNAGIDGINVQSSNGSASIESWGDVSAQNQGIFAKGNKGASIQSFGDVTTQTNDGIFAYNEFGGTGNATVVSVGDVKAGNRGIVAITGASGGKASIESWGKVTAKGAGVDAYSNGGAASVKQIGDVTSTDSSGIRAGANNADATIFSRGNVQAQTEGVAAHVSGNGNASVDHKGDVSVEDGNGITAVVSGNGNATIQSEGKVNAPVMGVSAIVTGSGNAKITHTGDVTSTTSTGIRAYVRNTGDATIVSKGTVKADEEGVAAIVGGAGNVSITHAGNVTSNTTRGVTGETNDGNVTIDVKGDVKSNVQGIYGRSGGAGDAVKITSNGDVTTKAGIGIYGEATNTGSTVTIKSQGDINAGGGNMGIQALADGNASIDSKGNVTALNGDNNGNNGIYAESSSGTAKVKSVGDVKAANQGIFAQGETGASIDSDGDVLAQDNDGIFAYANGTGDAKVVSRGDVSAVGRGPDDFSHTGGRGIASFAQNGKASIDSEGKVDARVDGVYALAGNGDATVRQIGDVSSAKANGIQAISQGAGPFNASVESKGEVTAAVNGVLAFRSGDGNASIKHQGDVTATGGFGIVAQTTGNGNASITESKGNVTAQTQGVAAIVQGKGDAIINHEGDVTSKGTNAITATVGGDGNATIVTKGKVQAQTSGVWAGVGISGGGNGNASVTHDGDVTSNATFGIRADVNGNGDATIDSSGKVVARMDGVTAYVAGDGNAKVTHDGNVTSDQSTGIAAFANANGNATVDSSGVVNSRWVGVSAIVNGNGNASVTHDGNVTSTDVEGILAVAKGTGDATIDSSGDVQAKSTGIQANANIGNAAITHDGKVTSSNARGVSAESNTGNVTINVTGDVNSKLGGIHGLTTGTDDAVKITSKGNVTTTEGIGIYGEALSGTSTVSIKSQGDINAGKGNMGIQAIAAGNASVESKGDVTALNSGNYGNDGINVQSFGGSASVTSVGDIKAANAGIFAQGSTGARIDSDGDVFAQDNDGLFARTNTGDASIKSRGNVDASGRASPETGGRGIFAQTSSGKASIDSEGEVKAQVQGVYAYSSSGDATVRQIGAVTSDKSNGIEAYSFGGITQTASVESKGKVTAAVNGITAFRYGDGSATIKHEGDVTGDKGQGIVATVYGGTGDAKIISKGKVDAQTQGVNAVVLGNGNASVTHDGDVFSDEAFGIRADVIDNVGDGSRGNGNATVDSSGKVEAKQHGVVAFVQHDGDASVTHDGDVSSELSAGVQAQAGTEDGDTGNATVNTTGKIEAQREGILGLAQDGNVKITHVGDITSRETYGVNAIAKGEKNNVTVSTNGAIKAELEGIQAIADGKGSSVSVTAAGSVRSTKIAGIRAQALGLGGTASIDSTASVTALTDGLFAQADEAVSVKQSGDVSVTYNNAIFAQSMNGTVDVWAGGGNVAGNENGVFALGSDDVNVTVTSGKVSANLFRGVFAQSTSGDVNVDVDGGWVVANGSNGDSDGVFVNAINGKGSATIVEGARVTGGSDKDASFAVEFGAATGGNTLTNYGLIDDANKGKTIGGGTSAEVVYNYGVVDGDFYLGAGANRFDNNDGGWMYFKAFSSVGAGNDFNNTGFVTPWGQGIIGNSVLEGNYNQSGTGQFVVDVDLDAGNSDYLDVTGNVGAGGTVAANVTELGTTPYSATIIHSNGLTTNNGIVGADQGALQVNVTTTSSTVDINVAIDFGGFGELEGNRADLGEYFQMLFEDTVGSLSPDQEAFYLALLNIGTMADYANGLDQLSPESANAPIIGTLYGAESFASNLFSCKPIDGAYKFISETTCVWTAVSGTWTDLDGGAGDLDLSDDSVSVSAGGQYAIDANWTVGFGLGYEHGESDANPSAEFDRDMFSAGVVAKAQFDALMLGAALTGGWGNIDSERHLTIPVVATAEGDRDIRYAAITGRAAYLMQMNNFYVKPMIEGAATFLSADGYEETGAGLANLKVEDSDEFYGRGTLSVELGAEFGSPDRVVVRPFVNGGVTFLTNSDIDVEAGFPGLGDGTVTLTTHRDNIYANVGAGVDVLAVNGLTGRLEYNGRFSSDEEQHRGTAKLSLRF